MIWFVKIISKTDFYIAKYAETNDNLSEFFRKVQQKLLGFIDNYDEENQQGELWRETQYLPNSDVKQNEKITERPQGVEIFDDTNNIFMKRKNLHLLMI